MGKGKVTPIQIAFIIECFLADNNYPTTLVAFRSEASDLFSKMKAKALPKGLLGLGEILDEYISLKEQRITVDQEKRRVEIVFQGLSDVMRAFSSAQPPTLLQQNHNGGSPPQGITGIQRHVIIAIRCSIRLEVPLGQVGSIMVSQEFAWYLVGIANEMMEANRKSLPHWATCLQYIEYCLMQEYYSWVSFQRCPFPDDPLKILTRPDALASSFVGELL